MPIDVNEPLTPAQQKMNDENPADHPRELFPDYPESTARRERVRAQREASERPDEDRLKHDAKSD